MGIRNRYPYRPSELWKFEPPPIETRTKERTRTLWQKVSTYEWRRVPDLNRYGSWTSERFPVTIKQGIEMPYSINYRVDPAKGFRRVEEDLKEKSARQNQLARMPENLHQELNRLALIAAEVLTTFFERAIKDTSTTREQLLKALIAYCEENVDILYSRYMDLLEKNEKFNPDFLEKFDPSDFKMESSSVVKSFLDDFKKNFGSFFLRPREQRIARRFHSDSDSYSRLWLSINTDLKIPNRCIFIPKNARDFEQLLRPKLTYTTKALIDGITDITRLFKKALVGGAAITISAVVPLTAAVLLVGWPSRNPIAFDTPDHATNNTETVILEDDITDLIVIGVDDEGKCLFYNDQLSPLNTEIPFILKDKTKIRFISTIDIELDFKQKADWPVPDLTKRYQLPNVPEGRTMKFPHQLAIGRFFGREDHALLTCRNSVTGVTGQTLVIEN